MKARARAGECVVCLGTTSEGNYLCDPCGRAYDRWNSTASPTTMALIEWTANRTRQFERKRAQRAARKDGAPGNTKAGEGVG